MEQPVDPIRAAVAELSTLAHLIGLEIAASTLTALWVSDPVSERWWRITEDTARLPKGDLVLYGCAEVDALGSHRTRDVGVTSTTASAAFFLHVERHGWRDANGNPIMAPWAR